MELKTELKLIKALNKLLPEEEYNHNPEDLLNKMVMCPSVVCGIIPKTLEFATILKRFTNKNKELKLPPLEYDREIGPSGFDPQYFKIISTILDSTPEGCHPTITTRKDYPIKFETDHYAIILAPRIYND